MNKKEHRRFLKFCVKRFPDHVARAKKFHFFTEDKPSKNDELFKFCLCSWHYRKKTWVSGLTGRWVEKEQQAIFEVIGFYRSFHTIGWGTDGEPCVTKLDTTYSTHHRSHVLHLWECHIAEGHRKYREYRSKKESEGFIEKYTKLHNEEEARRIEEWKERRFLKLKKAAVRRAPDRFFKLHAAAQAIAINTMKP